jgi:transposase
MNSARQDSIEKKLVANHLGRQANPSKMALLDLSSTWMTGNHCELAARGYSRDGKKGLPQINFGLLGNREGRPVAVRVFPGNTRRSQGVHRDRGRGERHLQTGQTGDGG